METITYEDKIEFLGNLLRRAKFLKDTCDRCMAQKDISIIECLIEDVNFLHELVPANKVKFEAKSSDGDIEKEMFYNEEISSKDKT